MARPRRGPEDGAAALELALVSPLFIACVFGIFNLGWALYCGAEVRHAIERSTRVIIADPATTEEQLITAVEGHLSAASIDDVGLELTTEDVGDEGQIARISWTYAYELTAPFINAAPLSFDSSIVVPLRTE